MVKIKKKNGCSSHTIEFCGEALQKIKERQAKALIETGSIISIPVAVNKLLLGK